MTQIPQRFAGAQIPVTTNISENVSTIKKAIDYAIENQCDYLVTPEGSLSGYSHGGLAATHFGIDPFHNFDELKAGLSEIEEYAKGKVGLCLGTLWKEKERFGEVGRNQIRFYTKDGELRGTTNKTYCINPQDLPFLEHDIEKEGIKCWALGDNSFKFNVVGLICNDMWGHSWSGGKTIVWTAYQNFNMNNRNECQLFIHSTNGGRGGDPKLDKLFNDWHNSLLTMLSHLGRTPIITVDNSIHMNGDPYEGETSSESGVIINGEWKTKVPRYGTQYFHYDFFGETYE